MPTSDTTILLRGGAVFTADPRRLWCDALVIRAGTVAATGSHADLMPAFPIPGRSISTDGPSSRGSSTPTITSSLTGESLEAINARFPDCASIDQLVMDLSAAAAGTPRGQWISAFGFDDAKYPRQLTRWDLDAASVTHPIRVYHVSGNDVYVNSSALAMRGVDEATLVAGSLRHRRAPDRDVPDSAMNRILPVAVDIGSHGPNFHTATTIDESVAAVDRASRAFLQAGLTTVCDAQVHPGSLARIRRLGRVGFWECGDGLHAAVPSTGRPARARRDHRFRG